MSPVDPELAQALSGGEGGVNYADPKTAIDPLADIVDTLPLGIANGPASPLTKAAERKRMNRRRALLIDNRLKSTIRSTSSTTPIVRPKPPTSAVTSRSAVSSRRQVVVESSSTQVASKPESSVPEAADVRRSRFDRVIRAPARFCALCEPWEEEAE